MMTKSIAVFRTTHLKCPTPPPRPPPLRRFGGSACWKATVHVHDPEAMDRLGAFVGYDTHLAISDATYDACVTSKMGECSDPSLTLLPASDKPCGGHIFVFDASNVIKKVLFTM